MMIIALLTREGNGVAALSLPLDRTAARHMSRPQSAQPDPPCVPTSQAFLEPGFLASARACLQPGGCIIVNLACHVQTTLDTIMTEVAGAFDWAMQLQVGVSHAAPQVLACEEVPFHFPHALIARSGVGSMGSQEGTLNRLVMAGTLPPALADASPALPLPCGERHLVEAVQMLLNPRVPKMGGSRLACVRSSASCAFGDLDSSLFTAWAKRLAWVKRPAAEMLSVVTASPQMQVAAPAPIAATRTEPAKACASSKSRVKSKGKGKRR